MKIAGFGSSSGCENVSREVPLQYVGDTEVAGVLFTWQKLDYNMSFTETWNASADGKTDAGSQKIAIRNGNTESPFSVTEAEDTAAVKAGVITIDPSKKTGVTTTAATVDGTGAYKEATNDPALPGAVTRTDATKKGDWTSAAEGVTDGITLEYLAKAAKVAAAGEKAYMEGSFHLRAYVADTKLADEEYVHVSDKSISVSVDDMYLAYYGNGDGTDFDDVTAGITVKQDKTKKVIPMAVDTVYGATLHQKVAAGVGTKYYNAAAKVDPDTVLTITAPNNTDNGDQATIAAAADSAGKSGAIQYTVTDGTKKRVLTVDISIVS